MHLLSFHEPCMYSSLGIGKPGQLLPMSNTKTITEVPHAMQFPFLRFILAF
uniref:Uncharacterized protein n=1 Tax=Anguilla anguilla TaxID=7936 RepID=A0A0E9PJ77_ANGAN